VTSSQVALTRERLCECLFYDPDSGLFTWKLNHKRKKAGEIAGSLHKQDRYIIITIDYIPHRAHTLAWFYMYGVYPRGLDHINRIRSDNAIKNLRLATKFENAKNRKLNSNNKSGYKGVSWKPSKLRWVSSIKNNNKIYYLGLHKTKEKAYQAYCLAASRLHGEFASV
jgi:hypothetical protein